MLILKQSNYSIEKKLNRNRDQLSVVGIKSGDLFASFFNHGLNCRCLRVISESGRVLEDVASSGEDGVLERPRLKEE